MTHNPNQHKPTQDLIREAALTHNKLVLSISGSAMFQGMTLGTPEERGLDFQNWPLGKLFAAMLLRLSILKTGGTATQVSWEIRQSEGGTGTDVVASGTNDALDHDEFFTNKIPWVNTETDDAKAGLLWVELTPTNGTLDASVRVVLEPRT